MATERESMVEQGNRAIVDAAIHVARETGADAILLAALAPAERAHLRRELGDKPRLVAASAERPSSNQDADRDVVTLPAIRLRRRGRAKVALLEALASGLLRPSERVVILSGNGPDSPPRLDTIAVVELAGEDDLMDGRGDETLAGLCEVADPAAFDALLGFCVQLGHEGREGRPVGFIATLGDHDAVLDRSRAVVMNPFEGHPEEERSILQASARRTLREFSGIDGAFVIRGDGVILAGGRYLSEIASGDAVPRGLGARHRAAAGISAATRCIAFTVSESTGDARVFGGGHCLMTIERSD